MYKQINKLNNNKKLLKKKKLIKEKLHLKDSKVLKDKSHLKIIIRKFKDMHLKSNKTEEVYKIVKLKKEI